MASMAQSWGWGGASNLGWRRGGLTALRISNSRTTSHTSEGGFLSYLSFCVGGGISAGENLGGDFVFQIGAENVPPKLFAQSGPCLAPRVGG